MSLTFNGVSSDSLGLFVERYPERPMPMRKQTVYQIRGRSGDLVVDDNAFSNVTQSYEVYILGGVSGFQTRANGVANWLLSVPGYAELTDSYDPTVYRRARFTGGVSFLNSLNKFGRATLTFDCCPQRYANESLTENLFHNWPAIVTVPTVAYIQDGLPLIKINKIASGGAIVIETSDITISLPVASQEILNVLIDFEKRIVYSGNDLIVPTVVGSWDGVGSGDTIRVSDANELTKSAVNVKTRRWYL